MCQVPYYAMIRSKNTAFDLRRDLVRFALQHGCKSAARFYKCSRNTVRKWLRRYRNTAISGLSELSRAPHGCPHKTPLDVEQQVLKQRSRTPGFGAARLKREFELPCGVSAISRILRQNGLTRRRKKKHHVKRDLRLVKAQYMPFTRLQMDVKYLNDIPNYWPYMTDMGLPKFEYTTRCPRLGAAFVSFANECSVTYAELTAKRLLRHLEQHGIPTETVSIQTDLGSEFDGQAMRKNDRGFTYTIEKSFGAQHRHSPPHCPNANADVESFHSLVETEFFNIERFRNPQEFWVKINTYQNYFNLARQNSYKHWKSPLDILEETTPQVSRSIFLLPPVDLATLLESQLHPQGGHDVPNHLVERTTEFK